MASKKKNIESRVASDNSPRGITIQTTRRVPEGPVRASQSLLKPASSLNRVLDGLLQKVKEPEKHMFAPETVYEARYDSPQGDDNGYKAHLPTTAVSNADTGNYYQ